MTVGNQGFATFLIEGEYRRGFPDPPSLRPLWSPPTTGREYKASGITGIMELNDHNDNNINNNNNYNKNNINDNYNNNNNYHY